MSAPYTEIKHLLYRYAELIDLGDFENLAELFRHASILSPSSDSVMSGYEEVLAMYSGSTRRYEDGTPHTQHVISNAIIDVAPDQQTASSRSRFTVYQSLADFPLQAIIAGRYHDRFELADKQWRFKERCMLPDLFGDLSRHLLFDASSIK